MVRLCWFIFFCSLFSQFSINNKPSKVETVDGVAAIVEKNVVLKSDVMQQAFMVAQQQGVDPSTSPSVFESVYVKTLDSMVDNLVLYELSLKDTNIVVDPLMVEESLNEEIKKRLYDQVNQQYIQKRNKYSQDLLSFAEKRVMLFQIDKDWRDHLAAMDSLRGSVNLRAMGGKDPFYEYKKESFDYFDEMLSNQNERVLKTLFNIKLVNENNNDTKDKQAPEPRRIITKI